MNEVALFDAKNRLSELISRVESGEEFVITRRGKGIARLVRLEPAPAESRRAEGAVDEVRAARAGVSLGSLKSRDLVAAGRR